MRSIDKTSRSPCAREVERKCRHRWRQSNLSSRLGHIGNPLRSELSIKRAYLILFYPLNRNDPNLGKPSIAGELVTNAFARRNMIAGKTKVTSEPRRIAKPNTETIAPRDIGFLLYRKTPSVTKTLGFSKSVARAPLFLKALTSARQG